MYEARFVAESGASFTFAMSSGVVFDVDPLSGAEVKIGTSQGFQQVGETVTSRSMGGIKRKISGVIFDRKNDLQIARKMQRALGAFARGRFYIGEVYCDADVSQTPEFIRDKSGKLTFSAQLYCALPYWLSQKTTSKRLGGYTPAFRFPVNYAQTHRFGVKSASTFVNCLTEGEADVPYTARFTTTTPATNFGLIDIHTMDAIKILGTLDVGEVVTIGREEGHLFARKTETDGTQTDIFGQLSEESTLFSLRAGDNVLKATADEGEDGLVVYVEYASAYVGVVT